MFSLNSRSIAIPSRNNALFHELLDYNMIRHGDRPIFTFAFPDRKNITEITFFEFGRAAHRIAHYVRPDPYSGKDNEVIAVLANVDTIVYHAITMGIVRSGLTPFLMSHRNSAVAVINMLQKTDCHRLLTTPKSENPILDALVDAIQAELPSDFTLSIEYIPHADHVYFQVGGKVYDDKDNFEAYPSKKRGLDDVAVYLHSSGSTGFPKPVPQTFRTLLLEIEMDYTIERATVDPPLRRVGTFGLPSFHTFAFLVELVVTLATSLDVCVLPPTNAMLQGDTISFSSYKPPLTPTTDHIIENARRTHAEALFVVPAFLDHWATEANEEKLAFLRHMRVVGFAGGPLAHEKGQFLVSQGVKLRSMYGGAEFNLTTHFWVPEDPDHKDWNYIQFSKRVHIDWDPQQDTDAVGKATIFELRLLPCETHNVAVQNYTTEVEINGKMEKIGGYATSDLWEKHPTKDLWRIVGRKDSLLMLSSGEKVSPEPIEEAIVANKRVRNAILFGHEREQVGVLIEPIKYDQDPSALIESIWPTIEASTTNSPSFSRIFKHLILITKEDKPMVLADKGTVKKKATFAAYAEEIDALYDTAEKSKLAAEPPQSWLEDDVMRWLTDRAQELLPSSLSAHQIDIYRSVFEQGFDSLSATFLRNQILAALRNSDSSLGSSDLLAKALPLDIVFSHAAISDLAKHVAQLVSMDGKNVSTKAETADRAKAIEATIARLSSGFKDARRAGPLIIPAVVLITGTTGGLGSFLLASLLKNDKVETVYAFNRPGSKSSKQRQIDAFVERDLPVELLDGSKIVFVEGNTAAEKLGLDSSLYKEIRSSVTAIVHNAWRLDFNLALSSFEPHLQGTRRLIDLALSSANVDSVRFLFTSSIGTAQSWPKEKGPYPEEMQHEAKYAVGSGYGEGKYVIERVLENSGLQATSLRIGQISGSVPSGYWATTDWFPLLVKSSVAMGSFPDLAGTAAWIPFTAVSDAIADVLFHSNAPSLALNLAHPRPSKWTNIISAVREAVIKTTKTINDTDVPLVPFSQWFTQLEGIAQTANEKTLENMPAVKILNFLRNLGSGESEENMETSGAVLSVNKMQALSRTVRTLEPIGSEDINAWVQYWKFKGLFMNPNEHLSCTAIFFSYNMDDSKSMQCIGNVSSP